MEKKPEELAAHDCKKSVGWPARWGPLCRPLGPPPLPRGKWCTSLVKLDIKY